VSIDTVVLIEVYTIPGTFLPAVGQSDERVLIFQVNTTVL